MIPDLNSSNQGRDEFLAFNDDIGNAIKKACQSGADNTVILAKAAEIIQKDLKHVDGKTKFSGSFDAMFETFSDSLIVLMKMIMLRSYIKCQTYCESGGQKIANML